MKTRGALGRQEGKHLPLTVSKALSRCSPTPCKGHGPSWCLLHPSRVFPDICCRLGGSTLGGEVMASLAQGKGKSSTRRDCCRRVSPQAS